MDVSAFRHQASITINRSPDEVYDVVSDVLEPDGDGTRVTETWEVLPGYPVYLRDEQALGDDELMARIEGMGQLARDGIPATLANLKRVVEG